jgi:hypothetical protein
MLIHPKPKLHRSPSSFQHIIFSAYQLSQIKTLFLYDVAQAIVKPSVFSDNDHF